MKNPSPTILAFWLVLAAIPIATFIVGLSWMSYWSVPAFPIRVDGGSIISYDPEMGFVPTPNSSTQRTDSPTLSYHIYTDRRGARVSRPGEQSADKLDVLFIGDSFTWGAGQEADDTYAALVPKHLHLVSANLAEASYGTTQTLQMLRRNLDTRPHTVIYPIITNHWRRNVSACAPAYYPFCLDTSYVGLDADGASEIRPPRTNGVRRADLQIQYEQKGLAPTQWVVHGTDVILGRILLRAANAATADPHLQAVAMDFLLSEMVKTTQTMDASLIVVFIPARDEVSGAPAQLAQLSRRLGFRLLDVTPSMRARGAITTTLYLPDGHPNRAGHALIAEDIINFLSGGK